jgi:hypothetical protein
MVHHKSELAHHDVRMTSAPPSRSISGVRLSSTLLPHGTSGTLISAPLLRLISGAGMTSAPLPRAISGGEQPPRLNTPLTAKTHRRPFVVPAP